MSILTLHYRTSCSACRALIVFDVSELRANVYKQARAPEQVAALFNMGLQRIRSRYYAAVRDKSWEQLECGQCAAPLHKRQTIMCAHDVVNNCVGFFQHTPYVDEVRRMLIKELCVVGITKKRVLEDKRSFDLMELYVQHCVTQ